MTMDGAPRPWMEHISEADWSPDGSTMAVTRVEGGKAVLEYPIGKALFESVGGYLSDLRVSPDGKQVAFFDHHIRGDDRGWVKVVDVGGTVKTLAGEYFSLEGLAWSPDGRVVFFSGSGQGAESMQPLAVNVAGTPAVGQALAGAGAMFIQDVARDGRLLIMRDDLRASIRALVPGESSEREFPWLDFAYTGYLSHDGKFLVFGDESQSAGTNYAVALRDVSNSRVLRLGEGSLLSLSPDDKWAAALVPSTSQFVLYPTGPGDTVQLNRGALEHVRNNLQWFPDGRRVLICGNEAGKAARCYEQDVTGGAPKAVTPEGTEAALLAADGRTLLLRTSADAYQVMTIGGGPPADMMGLTPADFPFSWTRDRRGIVVVAGVTIPSRIERVDVATGARTLIRELAPPDRAGVNVIAPGQWIEDGRGYVYSYFRELSKLFVVSGVTR